MVQNKNAELNTHKIKQIEIYYVCLEFTSLIIDTNGNCQFYKQTISKRHLDSRIAPQQPIKPITVIRPPSMSNAMNGVT